MKTNISNIVIGNIKKFLKPIIEETDKRRKTKGSSSAKGGHSA